MTSNSPDNLPSNRCSEHREPLYNFIKCLPDHDIGVLFNIIDVVKDNLIFESTDEQLIFSEFKTCLFIAAKAHDLLDRKSTGL